MLELNKKYKITVTPRFVTSVAINDKNGSGELKQNTMCVSLPLIFVGTYVGKENVSIEVQGKKGWVQHRFDSVKMENTGKLLDSVFSIYVPESIKVEDEVSVSFEEVK